MSAGTVVGYVRVSTDAQASEGVSLDAQRARLTAYCAAFSLTLLRVEADEGRSAKTLDRPALKRALASLDAGEASGLLVLKLDRLTRSVVDLGHLVERYFGEGKHRLLSVSDSIDTASAGGRLVLNVLVSVAQWEREAIAERTRDALRFLKANGVLLGAMPYGISRGQRSPEGGRLPLVAMPAEGATIARAGALRSSGLSARAIGAKLAAEGRTSKRGGRWGASVVLALAARAVVARVPLVAPLRVSVALPAHASSQNSGGQLRARIGKKTAVRDAVSVALLALREHISTRPALPVEVDIVLISPRAEQWDHDNAVARAKPLRDAVARWLGIDDREGKGCNNWIVTTRKGQTPACEITIKPAQ